MVDAQEVWAAMLIIENRLFILCEQIFTEHLTVSHGECLKSLFLSCSHIVWGDQHTRHWLQNSMMGLMVERWALCGIRGREQLLLPGWFGNGSSAQISPPLWNLLSSSTHEWSCSHLCSLDFWCVYTSRSEHMSRYCMHDFVPMSSPCTRKVSYFLCCRLLMNSVIDLCSDKSCYQMVANSNL